LAEFLEQCCDLDVLICEDLDWLEKSSSSQLLFTMLVEALEESLTQVLITAQKPVGEMRSLDHRLVSRCHGGLCVSMPLPGLETRIQLVQNWLRELKLPILKPFAASARFLAERLPVTPRDLHQAVIDLSQKQARRPSPIDVPYLERWLAKEKRTPQLSVDIIVLKVAHEFGVDPTEIRSHSRQQGLAIPRQCAILLARELTGQPLNQIGEYFERSHTTISHSLSRIKDSIRSYPSLKQQIQKLRQQLKDLPREDCA
jgi:chromosomal replication initiator protein